MLNCERQINDLHNRLYFLYHKHVAKIVFCCYTFCINFCSLLFFLFVAISFCKFIQFNREFSQIFAFIFSYSFFFIFPYFWVVILTFVVTLLQINTIESGAGVLGKGGPVTVYCDGKPLDLMVDRFILEELDQVRIKFQFLNSIFFAKLEFFSLIFAGFFIFIPFIITYFHSTP